MPSIKRKLADIGKKNIIQSKKIVLNCIISYIKNLSFNNFRKYSTKLSTISLLSLDFKVLYDEF